ncbi:MAG: hypothetical protein GOV02_01530 [Candidatus Aenigmarchaeota archaeon]|nr:hypothetical protein [Candidatus Aenigmarchaeota archaeon]
MFIVMTKNHCPSCGIKGDLWKRKPEVRICPGCNTYFNEFGIVVESMVDNDEVSFS